MERTLGYPVHVEVYPETKRFRAELAAKRFDLIFGKTVNLLAAEVRDKQFHALVKTKNPYVAGFVAKKDTPIKKPADLRATPVGLKDTPQGLEALKAIGVTEFVLAANPEYLDMLKYIGE